MSQLYRRLMTSASVEAAFHGGDTQVRDFTCLKRHLPPSCDFENVGLIQSASTQDEHCADGAAFSVRSTTAPNRNRPRDWLSDRGRYNTTTWSCHIPDCGAGLR